MKYKILFIDEEQETLDDFLDYIEASTQKGNITALTQLPLGDLNEMIILLPSFRQGLTFV